MEKFTIELKDRTGIGSSQSRRLRREGLIPSVVYSGGVASTPVSLVERDFRKIGSTAKTSQLFTLKSNNKTLDGKLAIVKEVQRSYVRDSITHVDFLTVREDQEIVVHVPLNFVGESPGVKNDGGILSISMHEINVECLPRNIPSVIEVDISALNVGDSIHAKDVKLPANVRLEGKPDDNVVSVVIPRAFEEPKAEEATAAAGAVPAEGAAVAGAEAGAATPAPAAEKGAAPAGKKDDKK